MHCDLCGCSRQRAAQEVGGTMSSSKVCVWDEGSRLLAAELGREVTVISFSGDPIPIALLVDSRRAEPGRAQLPPLPGSAAEPAPSRVPPRTVGRSRAAEPV